MRSSLSRFALIVSLLLVAAPFAVAQESKNPEAALSGQISGQVRYADTNQPAFNVMVSCDGFSGGLVGQVMTDRSGRFQFRGLSPEQYNISVRVQGFIPETQTVELLTSRSAYVSIQLRADKSNSSRTNSFPAVIDASVPPAAKKEFDLGAASLTSGKKDSIPEAVRHLEKAVSIHPQFIQAQLMLGTAYMDLQQWDNAEATLKKALELDPKAANASFALGEVYLHQKKADDAEAVIVKGLVTEDRSFRGHLLLGRIYWDKASLIKDEAQSRPLLEKSYEEVKRALELNPNLADAHLLKGNLLFRVRRAPDAVHEFEEYLRLEPKGPYAEATREMIDKIKKAMDSSKKQ